MRQGDEEIERETGIREANRYEPEDSEEFYQRAYLDELHSQFFDYVSGRGQSGFESPDADFYSTAGRGKHWEIASGHSDVREHTKELVYYLQAFILLNEAATAKESKEDMVVKYVVRRAGATLAVSRSIGQAVSLLKKQWLEVVREQNRKSELASYLSTYQQNHELHTPELSNNLRSVMEV